MSLQIAPAHHDGLSVAEPTARRGARDPKIGGDGHVPGALDEIPKPVIVAPLTASRARHADDHRLFAHAAQVHEDSAGRTPRKTGPLRDENSLPKVQNVGGDSSAIKLGRCPPQTSCDSSNTPNCRA